MDALDAILTALRAIGFDAGVQLAHSWAFHVDPEAPASIQAGIRMAEQEAWHDGHPKEVTGYLTLLANGNRYVVEALAYMPNELEDVRFYGFRPGEDTPVDLTLEQVRDAAARFAHA